MYILRINLTSIIFLLNRARVVRVERCVGPEGYAQRTSYAINRPGQPTRQLTRTVVIRAARDEREDDPNLPPTYDQAVTGKDRSVKVEEGGAGAGGKPSDQPPPRRGAANVPPQGPPPPPPPRPNASFCPSPFLPGAKSTTEQCHYWYWYHPQCGRRIPLLFEHSACTPKLLPGTSPRTTHSPCN